LDLPVVVKRGHLVEARLNHEEEQAGECAAPEQEKQKNARDDPRHLRLLLRRWWRR
jgi:hypothetical protein